MVTNSVHYLERKTAKGINIMFRPCDINHYQLENQKNILCDRYTTYLLLE